MSNPTIFQSITKEEARELRQWFQSEGKKAALAAGLPTTTTVQKVISEKNFFQKFQSLQPKSLVGKITLGVTILASLYAIRLAAPFVVEKAQFLYGKIKKYWSGS